MNKEDKATQQPHKMQFDEMRLQEKKPFSQGQLQGQQSGQTQSQAQQPQAGQAYETQSYRAQLQENPQQGTKTYEMESHKGEFVKPGESQSIGSQSQGQQSQGQQSQGVQSYGTGQQSQGVQSHGTQSYRAQLHENEQQGTKTYEMESHRAQFHELKPEGPQSKETQSQGQQSQTGQFQGTIPQQGMKSEQGSQSHGIQPQSHAIQPQSHGIQPQSHEIQPQSHGIQPQSQGTQSQGTQVRAVQPHASELHGTQVQPLGQPSQVIQAKETQSQGAQGHGPQSQQGMDTQTRSAMSLETWSQPLPDAKGSVIGKPNYQKEDAKQDAIKLQRAISAKEETGIDKAVIVAISGNRTFKQRRMIAEEYALLDGTEKRDLVADLKNALRGDMENLLLPLYMMPGEYDARLLEKAMYGIRNDVDVLIEVLCTRTNEEIEAMKRAWTEKIDPKQRLEERVSNETKKLFGVTNFHLLCSKLLEAKRPPCRKPDPKQVRADAEELHHQLLERSDIDQAKLKFVEVFTERSWAHLGAVVGEFQTISNKWTMEHAISEQFSDSSNTTKALRVLAEFCFQPYDFWAKKLRTAIKGVGTDDGTLARIIVSRCEVDLSNVAKVFGERYGDGLTLRNWIEQDTSGYYSQLLLNLCGYY